MPAEIPHAGLISIHAPRKGERRKFYVRGFNRFSISIHAPRKGERLEGFCSCVSFFAISIHAPRKGERPYPYAAYIAARAISIHAPRKGERLVLRRLLAADVNFNPRSPQGGATQQAKKS